MQSSVVSTEIPSSNQLSPPSFPGQFPDMKERIPLKGYVKDSHNVHLILHIPEFFRIQLNNTGMKCMDPTYIQIFKKW